MPTLPFFSTGVLKDQSGTTLEASLPISIWPTSGGVTDVGIAYDHDAECPSSYFSLIRTGNARITVDGITYMIVDAALQRFVPHVSLRLREMRTMI